MNARAQNWRCSILHTLADNLVLRCALLRASRMTATGEIVPTVDPRYGTRATSQSSRRRTRSWGGFASTRPSRRRCAARRAAIAPGWRRCGRGGGTTITSTSACAAGRQPRMQAAAARTRRRRLRQGPQLLVQSREACGARDRARFNSSFLATSASLAPAARSSSICATTLSTSTAAPRVTRGA